ncbi:MAG: bifunctional UDP-N-acetylglucosamine diphosphorylase/glucosamine-1-phosphate N-acetyltransferase GlmU [Christensenellales bacterium]|jgi:bifunctional UDP-N-acetylglucosamine pyrophosphorylase/glucosamine-1-phosphate N-acetyltransferase
MKAKVIILAAGEGKRMRSSLAKPLLPVCGRPMLEWVMEAASVLDTDPVVVVGHGREQLINKYPHLTFAVQDPPKGTGHAVMMAEPWLEDDATAVILAGDTPLIPKELLQQMTETMHARGCAGTLLVAELEDPSGYGRILTDFDGHVTGIVEHKDATEEQRKIRLINTLCCCFRGDLLKKYLHRLTNHNIQGEYYLTDVVGMLVQDGYTVGYTLCPDPDAAMGVNDRVQLANAEKAVRKRINTRWMLEGVTMIDPERICIGPEVILEKDTVIYPDNILEGRTTVGRGCILYPGSHLKDTRIGDEVQVRAAVTDGAVIGNRTMVGPFAYLRPGTVIGEECRIGDFVEVKNSTLGDGTKLSHLSYVGDADVGKDVNIGCGVVFSNYDGTNKYHTTVEDGVFIGGNTNLVAPVTLGEGAYTAAGSTITEDVPPRALAIARTRQVNKTGWVSRYTRKEH